MGVRAGVGIGVDVGVGGWGWTVGAVGFLSCSRLGVWLWTKDGVCGQDEWGLGSQEEGGSP